MGAAHCVGTDDGVVYLIDELGRTRGVHHLSKDSRHDAGIVVDLDFAGDDQRLAAATVNGVFALIDLRGSAIEYHLPEVLQVGHAIQLMPDERVVVSGMRRSFPGRHFNLADTRFGTLSR